MKGVNLETDGVYFQWIKSLTSIEDPVTILKSKYTLLGSSFVVNEGSYESTNTSALQKDA